MPQTRADHQRSTEVIIKERGIEILSLSPDAARALADALREHSDHAEQ